MSVTDVTIDKTTSYDVSTGPKVANCGAPEESLIPGCTENNPYDVIRWEGEGGLTAST